MEDRNLRKVRVGLVVSNKMDKTVTVAIADNVKHPSTVRSLSTLSRFTLMTRTTSAASAIRSALWKPVLSPRLRDGV